jgi:hypothetical protein
MDRYFFYSILLGLTLILQSCVDLSPYRVGDNVDRQWSILQAKGVDEELNKTAGYICYSNTAMKNIAIGIFATHTTAEHYDGIVLAQRLKDKLIDKCGLSTYTINTYQYLDKKNYGKLIKQPPKKYEFLVYGYYRYIDRGYDFHIIIADLKSMKIIKSVHSQIPLHKLRFDIDTLHIPQEIELQ